MKECVRSSHPLPPTRHFFYVTQHHTRSRISINFKALRSPHRRWPVGRALDSDHRGRGFESPRRFCLLLFYSFFFFVFSFVFSLFLDFIDSSAFPLFLFLIGLRFVNYILLEISKSGHYTRLYVAYIIKSCNPYPYHKAFSVAIVKIVL